MFFFFKTFPSLTEVPSHDHTAPSRIPPDLPHTINVSLPINPSISICRHYPHDVRDNLTCTEVKHVFFSLKNFLRLLKSHPTIILHSLGFHDIRDNLTPPVTRHVNQ